MSCPPRRLRRTAGLRLRPVPELETCIVYTPATPQLYTLNPNAWLILELAPGLTLEELGTAYEEQTVPPMTEPLAKRQLREGLEMLLSAGVLEFETETEATR